MKWLIRVAIVLVLLVVVAAVAGVVMIDSIATAAVTKGAAFATQTDADCEKVDVKLFGSAGEIRQLEIKNPDGPYTQFAETFDSPYKQAFENFLVLGNGKAEVTAGSVLSDKIEIPRVELSDIEITLIGKDGKKNYETILESLKRFQGDTPPKGTEDQKKVVIKELIIRNITVYYYFDKDPALDAIAVGPKKIVIADDEPMVLKDVGSGGVPMSQITADIIADVLVQVMANMGDDLGNHVLGLTASLTDTLGVEQLQGTLSDLGLADFDLGEKLKDLTALGGEFGEQAGEWIKQGGSVLEGILGGDNNNEEGDGGDGGSLLDRGRDLLN
ncbi:MAG: hypothetical protein ACE37H_10570 [Phycisphaeraceae bacterium]